MNVSDWAMTVASDESMAAAERIQKGLFIMELAKNRVEREREKEAWDNKFAAVKETVTVSNNTHNERALGLERCLKTLQESVTAFNDAHDARALGFEKDLKALQETITTSNNAHAEQVFRHDEEMEELRESVTTLHDAYDTREGEVKGLQETVKALQEEVKHLRETVTTSKDGQRPQPSELKVAHADTVSTPEQVSRPVLIDTERQMERRKVKVLQMEKQRDDFARYLIATGKQYRSQRLNGDERSHIWSFIEGFVHKDWVLPMQEFLLKKLPEGKAWRSKSRKNGRIIALSPKVKWEEVYKILEDRYTYKAHMRRQ